MLKLNDSKTEYLVIGSRHTISKVSDVMKSVKIGEEKIAMTSSARNIGIIMDSIRSMEEQVAIVCRECYLRIRNISRIRKYLMEEATTHLIMAFVKTSKLDCNNALLHKCHETVTSKQQLI